MSQLVITFDINENNVAENAEKEAGRQLAKKIMDQAFGNSYQQETLMKRYVQNAIAEMLEPMKEQIISEAIKEVMANVHRTKMFKEKFGEAT